MSQASALDAYGTLIEPATLKIQRLLPGPIERVWAYLTESELRRQWLAAGAMELKQDAPFELTWRNDELTDPPGRRPDGFGEEHRLESRILDLDPPRRLAIAWHRSEVAFDLEPAGADVLLTIVHSRLPDDGSLQNVSPGWHAHLDVLEAKMRGRTPPSFWDRWSGLKTEYAVRFAA